LEERTDFLNHRAQNWLALAEVQRAAGLAGDAEESIERAVRLYEQKGNVAAVGRVRATAAI